MTAINLSRGFFFDLETKLRAAGLDSDAESFDAIKARLMRKEPLGADEFAAQAIYVILAGGFSQKTAKTVHAKIMSEIKTGGGHAGGLFDRLIKIFNNKNKIAAAADIWENRRRYRDGYYQAEASGEGGMVGARLAYLAKLPHIGKITANHLARNLGENVVKYDIWIQRLGAAFAASQRGADAGLDAKIDNGDLHPEIKDACDMMFAHLERETGLPRGYIDVVLWKACQNGLIKL
jgi:hypothetical protein